jgi:hypothetical protein
MKVQFDHGAGYGGVARHTDPSYLENTTQRNMFGRNLDPQY